MKTGRPNVTMAISYNQKKGGAAADSMRRLIFMSGARGLDIDYYQIVSSTNDISDIYSNEEKMQEIFKEAKKNAKILLENADCLILPGNGSVVDPRLYENTPKAEWNIDLSRAIAEMALAHVAMEKGMPILAICGGHQILNVYLGGKLKDIDDDKSIDDYMAYSINEFLPESELGKAAFRRSKKQEENFFGAHSQVVDANHIGGKGMIRGEDFLAVVANSKNDSTIEAMEATHGATLYSLQFHPEVAIAGMYSTLFKAIMYHAPTKKALNVSLNIFSAFKKATEAYANKKNMLVQIETEIPTKDGTRPAKSGKSKSPNQNKTSHRSRFMEAKTTPNDPIFDVNIKKKK